MDELDEVVITARRRNDVVLWLAALALLAIFLNGMRR